MPGVRKNGRCSILVGHASRNSQGKNFYLHDNPDQAVYELLDWLLVVVLEVPRVNPRISAQNKCLTALGLSTCLGPASTESLGNQLPTSNGRRSQELQTANKRNGFDSMGKGNKSYGHSEMAQRGACRYLQLVI